MTAQVDYLVVVFTATSGASGELLGSDERELVQLVWQLVDVKNKTVKDLLLRWELSQVICVKLKLQIVGNRGK